MSHLSYFQEQSVKLLHHHYHCASLASFLSSLVSLTAPWGSCVFFMMCLLFACQYFINRRVLEFWHMVVNIWFLSAHLFFNMIHLFSLGNQNFPIVHYVVCVCGAYPTSGSRAGPVQVHSIRITNPFDHNDCSGVDMWLKSANENPAWEKVSSLQSQIW